MLVECFINVLLQLERHSLMEMLRCSWDDACDCRCSFKMSSSFKFCNMLHVVQSWDTLVLLCVDADHYISCSNSCFWSRIMKENAEIWLHMIHYFEWSCAYNFCCAVAHFHITKLYGWPHCNFVALGDILLSHYFNGFSDFLVISMHTLAMLCCISNSNKITGNGQEIQMAWSDPLSSIINMKEVMVGWLCWVLLYRHNGCCKSSLFCRSTVMKVKAFRI